MSRRSCSFGAAPRLPKPPLGGGPGPGAYAVPTTLGGVSVSVAGPIGAEKALRKSDMPGPGAYRPRHTVTELGPKDVKIGAGKRPKMKFAQGPGPGEYALPSTLGGNSDSREPFVPCYSFTHAPCLEKAKEDTNPGPMAAPTMFPQYCKAPDKTKRRDSGM